MKQDDLSEYLRAKEPAKAELAGMWRAAIGLQKVDGLTPSAYLMETARRNIEGEITLEEAGKAIGEYYFRNALVRANYSNIPKGIEETTEYLERFFRNALMGEENKLQSRFLLVGGWKGDSTPASKDDTPISNPATPTSKTAAPASRALALSRAVRILIDMLDGEMSRAKIMKAIGIKDRVTFADYYLAPALKLGIVEMTQPNSPRSPTQKYRLTPKGLAVKGGA